MKRMAAMPPGPAAATWFPDPAFNKLEVLP